MWKRIYFLCICVVQIFLRTRNTEVLHKISAFEFTFTKKKYCIFIKFEKDLFKMLYTYLDVKI